MQNISCDQYSIVTHSGRDSTLEEKRPDTRQMRFHQQTTQSSGRGQKGTLGNCRVVGCRDTGHGDVNARNYHDRFHGWVLKAPTAFVALISEWSSKERPGSLGSKRVVAIPTGVQRASQARN